jgi:SAM-dependent methyltransferase
MTLLFYYNALETAYICGNLFVMSVGNQDKAALCGEPSYVWRAGQERRLRMILQAVGERIQGFVLEDGCGIGMYVRHLAPHAGQVFGLEFDFDRAQEARRYSDRVLCGAGEQLPYPDGAFDVVLSNEVIEHVQDDRLVVREMVRVLQYSGRIVLFCPNRDYPFETHGVFWRGKYHFGNIPLVNYLPHRWREKLAPHVRIYGRRDLERLFVGLPVRFVQRTVIFGGYDNIVYRWPNIGKVLRAILQGLEHTPLRALGLSHFWVVEKVQAKTRESRGSHPE